MNAIDRRPPNPEVPLTCEWGEAWGHSRITGGTVQRMRARLRDDGDVDVLVLLRGRGWVADVCPAALWRAEAWMLGRQVSEGDDHLAVLRVVVDLDDPSLLVGLTESHRRKLAAGIVCTSYPHGLTIAWGEQSSVRPELAPTFVDVDAAIDWLCERAGGLRTCADLCPGTATASYSRDRAAFLLAAASILRRYASRLWDA